MGRECTLRLVEASTQTRTTHFPLFDGLRGVAACAVFLVHGAYQFAVARPGEEHAWYRFVIHLDVAVPIFFAISGFLLYRPFVAARVRGKPLSVRQYAWRRFLRITPGYWVALPIVALWLGLDEIGSVAQYLWFMFFLQLYDPDTALKALGQAWTLCIEVTYYAFLPLWVAAVAWFIRRSKLEAIKAELAAVLALIAGAFLWQMGTLAIYDVANNESISPTLIRILPIQFDHLGAGMLLAVLSVWVVEARRKGEPTPLRGLVETVEARPWIPWLAGIAVWIATCYVGRDGGRSSYHYTDAQFFAEHVMYTPFVFLLLAPAVFGDDRRQPIRRFLAWKPIAYVGMISFSFYLYHFAVLVQQAKWWESAGWGTVPDTPLKWAAWLAGAFAGTVAVGSISFWLIEKPFMSLKYRGGGKRIAPQAEAAQAKAAP
jgi:peptidoglycan/LPS O-acetylase OafA/YrhL